MYNGVKEGIGDGRQGGDTEGDFARKISVVVGDVTLKYLPNDEGGCGGASADGKGAQFGLWDGDVANFSLGIGHFEDEDSACQSAVLKSEEGISVGWFNSNFAGGGVGFVIVDGEILLVEVFRYGFGQFYRGEITSVEVVTSHRKAA